MPRSSLPPGPSSKLWSTYRLMSAPCEVFPAWRARYGDPFTIPALNGTIVMTGEPEGIREIFAAPPETYAPFGTQASGPLLGSRSIFVSEGAQHRHDRSLLGKPFLRGKSDDYAALIEEVVSRRVAELDPERPLELMPWAQGATLEVILRTIFGVDSPEMVEVFTDQVARTTDAISPSFLFAPVLQRRFGGLSPFARFERERDRFAALIADQVERARAGSAPESVLALLAADLEFAAGEGAQDALLDQLRTLLFAGHETTATALGWCVAWLVRSPEAYERLRAELEVLPAEGSLSGALRLEYLEAVIYESLRIYPLVTEVLRVLREPMDLCGYHLEPGLVVSASSLLAHWREETFPEPQRFRPERFLGTRFGPHEYLPFGGGSRRCIGAPFALVELKLLLAGLLRRFDLESLDPNPLRAQRRNLTLAPRGLVPLRLLARQSAGV